jgi:hypothetical protein
MSKNLIVPGKSVGDLRFDHQIEDLTALGFCEDMAAYNEITRWHTYAKNDDLNCYVKDGAVVCISCFRECIYNGNDLIKKRPNEIIQILGEPDEIGEDVWVSEDTAQIPYEYYSLGLQIWFENERVICVYCDSPSSE